jgi:hypothetical protein
MHDERQQWPGADERDALADRDALRLERDLRTAEGGDAGQRPARKRQHAVHRAGGEQEAVERDLAVPIAREHVEAVAEDVPHQRARPVVDAAGVEHAVDRFGLARLEPVDRGRIARCRGWRLAVDLAARPLGLVEHDRHEPGARDRLGGTQPRRAGTDDDDDGISHGDRLRRRLARRAPPFPARPGSCTRARDDRRRVRPSSPGRRPSSKNPRARRDRIRIS